MYLTIRKPTVAALFPSDVQPVVRYNGLAGSADDTRVVVTRDNYVAAQGVRPCSNGQSHLSHENLILLGR